MISYKPGYGPSRHCINCSNPAAEARRKILKLRLEKWKKMAEFSSSPSGVHSKKISETLLNLERWVEKTQVEICDLSGRQEDLKNMLIAAGDNLTTEWGQRVQSQLKGIHKALEEINRLLKNP